jgi:predicted RNA methylase
MFTKPKSANNTILTRAYKAKTDEFYTVLTDVENEMATYTDHNPDVFAGKVILLPCDDPDRSNFTKHFLDRFEAYRAKAVISTCYNPSGKGKYLIHTAAKHLTGELQNNGRFGSREVTALRDKADFIITNPPFSLFRKFIDWVLKANKQYAVLGNLMAISNKNVFSRIKSGAMKIGLSIRVVSQEFQVPDNYPLESKFRIGDDGRRYVRVNVRWFTNIPAKPYTKILALTKAYDPSIYPKYDNYDAINVNKVSDIPKGYGGVMGVPLNFIDKYNPEQFEIVGSSAWRGQDSSGVYGRQVVLDGKVTFSRLFVKAKSEVS